jgi:4-hydroxy-4-methyl-2-oxoglutarate aldolase
VPAEIAGVRFEPGDVVVADGDGIGVIPRRIEAAVIQRAWAKVHAETRMRAAIEGGMRASDAFKEFGIL